MGVVRQRVRVETGKLSLLLLATGLVAPSAPAAPPGARSGIVAAIHDGDTLDVDLAGEMVRLDLAGADCPEDGQPFADEARLATLRLAYLDEVEIEVVAETASGRPVVRLTLEDGTDLAHELIRRGLARRARHGPAAVDDPELDRLEREAREAERGLWGPPPMSPRSRSRSEPEAPRESRSENGRETRHASRPPVRPDRGCTPRVRCCKLCRKGKACGNTCIRRSYTCHKGRGCACNAAEVC